MNQNLQKLNSIIQKKKRRIIGLMSGTSLDGLDIALCSITGSGQQTEVKLERFLTKSYDRPAREKLNKITSVETVQLKELCYQHRWLGEVHANFILKALSEWNINPGSIDAIASHGQTIYHYPANDQTNELPPLNSTLQIGDGDSIAAKTGIVTISDFRQKHIAHGGEGAPLAALVDNLLFGHGTEPRILLNIGGIANYTYIPPGNSSKKNSFTTDTGPGNTLIDHLVHQYFDKPFDRDGKVAESGQRNEELLQILRDDAWFSEEKSKSTGPEYFNIDWMKASAEQADINYDEISPEDLISTATELSAVTIAENIKKTIIDIDNCQLYVSGGGAHNPVLMEAIRRHLNKSDLHDFSILGFDADAKEAVIFAVLANEALAGDGFEFESGAAGLKKIQLGKISFPK